MYQHGSEIFWLSFFHDGANQWAGFFKIGTSVIKVNPNALEFTASMSLIKLQTCYTKYNKILHFCTFFLRLPFSPSSSSPQLFRNIGEFGAKNILQTLKQLVQFGYLLLKKKIFLVYCSSEQVAAKGHSSQTA